MKMKPFTKKDYRLLVRAFKFTNPYKIKFICSVSCVIGGIVLGLIQPLIWGNLLTRLFSKNYKFIITFILYLLALYIIESILSFIQTYLFSYLNEHIIYDLKSTMFCKILNLPIAAFDNIGVGAFLSRLHEDTSEITNIITNQLLNSMVDIIRVIAIGILVFTISPILAVIVIIAFPLTYYVFLKSGKILKEKNRKVRAIYDNYFSNVQESLTSIREIKSLGIKNSRIETFNNLCFKMKSLNIKMAMINSASSNISQMINFVLQLSIYSVGAYLIYKNELKMQYFIAFSAYSQLFSNSLISLTTLNSTLQRALISLERIFNLMDSEEYSLDIFGSRNMDKIKGNISFNKVSFNYSGNTQILNDISFNIESNKKYAIVGLSGGGKSTIFNLILRFYDPTSGIIKIDGIDIKEFSEKSLRKNISVVRQELVLFNMSIMENLLLVNENATIKEVQKACKAAHIHDFIISLPKGYNSVISENSVNFSGGQKQRLAIARAILKNSKIILFDEATSSLDNEAQYEIKKSINELAINHTIIIITHRILTIVDAHAILVIENGKIVGQGNHKFLIDSNEIYKRLYEKEVESFNN